MKELHLLALTGCKAGIHSEISGLFTSQKSLLRGISIAMYIVGQERRLVDPPSQVVARVRTVTTKMDERCDAHVAALIRFLRRLILTRNNNRQFDSRSQFA